MLYTEEKNADVNTELKPNHCEEKIRIKEFIRAGAIALLAAIIVKSFFFEAYKIPTGSMENTLLAGDFIIVNKSAYSFSTPGTIPFLNIDVPQLKIFTTGKPAYNDIIVFKFPGYAEELSPSMDASYIKRITGLPGDTIRVINKVLFVNNKKAVLPFEGKISKSSSYGPDVIERRIFPSGRHWNRDNYGPLIVPKKGTTIVLDPKTIHEWKTIIDREFGKRVVSDEGTVITIEGKAVRSYTFKKNYYFVMGDNRDDSMDSRYWGFVSEDALNGKALMVYWSIDQFNPDKESNFFRTIRLNRIFKIIE
jgi:signal peptidase I